MYKAQRVSDAQTLLIVGVLLLNSRLGVRKVLSVLFVFLNLDPFLAEPERRTSPVHASVTTDGPFASFPPVVFTSNSVLAFLKLPPPL